MVIDRLERWRLYAGLHPRLASAFEFLCKTELHKLSVGKHAIDGEEVFALVQDYQPKPAEECVWESHRKYTDVQYMVRGVERMGYADIEGMTVKQEYDLAKDVVFYSGSGDFVTVPAGVFAIFFAPQDVHMPGVEVPGGSGILGSGVEEVRKVVVKVLGIE